MYYFTIPTNRSTADRIQDFFNSAVLTQNISIKLKGIDHQPRYSVVSIASTKPDTKIDPVDIFWMGFYSGIEAGQDSMIPENH